MYKGFGRARIFSSNDAENATQRASWAALGRPPPDAKPPYNLDVPRDRLERALCVGLCRPPAADGAGDETEDQTASARGEAQTAKAEAQDPSEDQTAGQAPAETQVGDVNYIVTR